MRYGTSNTVTLYVVNVPSAAVTVYGTTLVKLFAVTPLVCTVDPTFTSSPVAVNVAIRFDTFEPAGSVKVMVFAALFITPVYPGDMAEAANE